MYYTYIIMHPFHFKYIIRSGNMAAIIVEMGPVRRPFLSFLPFLSLIYLRIKTIPLVTINMVVVMSFSVSPFH